MALCLLVLSRTIKIYVLDVIFFSFLVDDETKAYIVARHNELRGGVDPAPSNMLKMVSSY